MEIGQHVKQQRTLPLECGALTQGTSGLCVEINNKLPQLFKIREGYMVGYLQKNMTSGW